MTKEDLDRRQLRAESEAFVIAQTDDGFRVYSPLAPANQFLIIGVPDKPVCSCPDFQQHAGDPEWRCKHILTVLNHQVRQNHQPGGNDSSGTREPAPDSAPPAPPPEQKKALPRSNGGAQMLLKRSVSPDGRIDSLSVEFSCPVGKTTTEEIKQRAEKTLKLQAEIVQGFLKTNGTSAPPPPVNVPNQQDGTVPAQLLGVGGMNGKWGRRLFLNVLVNGQAPAKYFGSDKQLAEALTAVGFPNLAPQVSEGVQFNLPCRVVTKPSPDGRYLNIEQVLPAQASVPKGGG